MAAQTCRLCSVHGEKGVTKKGHACRYKGDHICNDCVGLKKANQVAACDKKAKGALKRQLMAEFVEFMPPSPGKRRQRTCAKCLNHGMGTVILDDNHLQKCIFANCPGTNTCNCKLTNDRRSLGKAQIAWTRLQNNTPVASPLAALPLSSPCESTADSGFFSPQNFEEEDDEEPEFTNDIFMGLTDADIPNGKWNTLFVH